METSADVEVLGTTDLSERILVVALADTLERVLAVALADALGYNLAKIFPDRVAEPVTRDRKVEFADEVEEIMRTVGCSLVGYQP